MSGIFGILGLSTDVPSGVPCNDVFPRLFRSGFGCCLARMSLISISTLSCSILHSISFSLSSPRGPLMTNKKNEKLEIDTISKDIMLPVFQLVHRVEPGASV